MALVSFRAALTAGAIAFLSTTGLAIGFGTAFAQDTSNAQPATDAPTADAPTTDAPTTDAKAPVPDNATPGAENAAGSGDTAQNDGAAGGNAQETAPAQPPADPKEVLATVNGKPITRQDVVNSAAELPPQYQAQIDLILPQLLNRLIGFELVREKGEAEGLANDPQVKKAVEEFQRVEIGNVYFQRYIEKQVTEDAIKTVYEADLKAHPPQPEIRAAHILVKTEDEAKAIIDQLKGGADFAALAKAKSIDTASGKEGGELGWFSRDTMVKEFSDAAFQMQKGDISKTPVKTQFGYHVIKIEDSRMQVPPTLAERRDEIRQVLGQEAAHKLVQDLIANGKVSYSKPEYKLPESQ
jgi:peptidyl-prolyl cis-trans isomerase C